MKKLSQYLNFLICAVVLGFGVFYFLSAKKSERNLAASAEQNKPQVNVDDVVNKYIKQTADQILRDQVRSQQNIRQQLSKPIVVNKAPEVNPQDIPVEQQIWKDKRLNQLNAEAQKAEQQSIEEQKRQEELDKKEFARQYIENARKDGYHVVLSPDLQVLSVTPIRKPSQTSDTVETFPSQ